jgi:hypothetical protein
MMQLKQRWIEARAKMLSGANATATALKAFSPYAWVPILTVGIVSAFLSYNNLSFQQSGSRPEMTFNRMELRDPYDDGIFSLGMLNVGTRTAYDYQLDIRTLEIATGKVVKLVTVSDSNPIRRQAGGSAEPRLDMSRFLDVLALCVSYRDENDRGFDDVSFVYFPTMTRGLKKDKGGGGQYLAASVSPDERRKLEKFEACKD